MGRKTAAARIDAWIGAEHGRAVTIQNDSGGVVDEWYGAATWKVPMNLTIAGETHIVWRDQVASSAYKSTLQGLLKHLADEVERAAPHVG